MADQSFHKEQNYFFLDLHKCSTSGAINIIQKRIDECFKYGITTLEIIFGTPDIFEGSIEQAALKVAEENELIESYEETHAGVYLLLKINPNPEPQDDNMCFSSFDAVYERFKIKSYENDYYPLRETLTTYDIAKNIHSNQEYVRSALDILPDNTYDKITEYNEYTRHNNEFFIITKTGADIIAEKWNLDSNLIKRHLEEMGADSTEITEIIDTVRTPLKDEKAAKGYASRRLKVLRNKKAKLIN